MRKIINDIKLWFADVDWHLCFSISFALQYCWVLLRWVFGYELTIGAVTAAFSMGALAIFFRFRTREDEVAQPAEYTPNVAIENLRIIEGIYIAYYSMKRSDLLMLNDGSNIWFESSVPNDKNSHHHTLSRRDLASMNHLDLAKTIINHIEQYA